MTVRHIALFRFREDTTEGDVHAISAALHDLREVIEEITAYQCGPDLGLSDRTWDYAVVADFASADDYETYRTHPSHVDVIERWIAPHVAERAAAQLDV